MEKEDFAVGREQSIQVHGKIFVPFIDRVTIQERIAELGVELTERYRRRNPVFLGVLNGAFVFCADLLRACKMECEVAFIRMSSYRGMHSSGDIITVLGLDKEISGRHVIIVEDIIDTGRTMRRLISDLKASNPASVAVVSLLFKPEALEAPLDVDFTGFEIPNKFVLGYGLDYDGIGRNLPDLYQLGE